MRATSGNRARDGWLIALAVAGIVAVSFAARSSPVPVNELHRNRLGVAKDPATIANEQGQLNDHAHPSSWHLPLHIPWSLIRFLGVVAIAIGVLLLVLMVIKVVPRIGLRRVRLVDDEPVRYAPADGKLGVEVSATFDAALAGLRRGDHERAIIECWLRLEQLADSAGYPVRVWQTSTEEVSWWLSVLPLPEPPLTELAELYREARYSSHRMSEQAVERARRALATLRAGLADRVTEDV